MRERSCRHPRSLPYNPLPQVVASRPRHDQYYAPELRHPNRPRDELLPVRSIRLKGMQLSSRKFPRNRKPEIRKAAVEAVVAARRDHAKESVTELFGWEDCELAFSFLFLPFSPFSTSPSFFFFFCLFLFVFR